MTGLRVQQQPLMAWLICDHSPLIVHSYTEFQWAPAVNGPGNCNHQLQQKWEETHRSMFKMSWFLLKSSLAPHTHTHIYLHSNEYKLSVTECIELFMCQMFHPSWCQVPGCHTTGHTGCGECDANVLLIRYLIISTIRYLQLELSAAAAWRWRWRRDDGGIFSEKTVPHLQNISSVTQCSSHNISEIW